MKLHRIRYLLVLFVAFTLSAHISLAEKVKTTTVITTTRTEANSEINELQLDQLVSALVNLNGKILNMTGTLEYNFMDELVFTTNGGTKFYMELDDGRSVSKRALMCKPTPCDVELKGELQIDHYSGRIWLHAIGFDVNFFN